MMLKCVEYWYEISIHLPISVSNKYLLHLIEIQPFWVGQSSPNCPNKRFKKQRKYIHCVDGGKIMIIPWDWGKHIQA